ncbi:hypothetical protein ACFL0Q_00140 [Thermodesulfobacteriota bacterium]
MTHQVVPVDSQERRLRDLEETISQNLTAFYEVGRALKEIRDTRLYTEVLGYSTFEEYCRDRWDMSHRHAYRLLESASVVENLKCDQLVTQPLNESQARPLTRLPAETQAKAWQEVLNTAPEGKVTARHVTTVVAQYIRGGLPPPPPGSMPGMWGGTRPGPWQEVPQMSIHSETRL